MSERGIRRTFPYRAVRADGSVAFEYARPHEHAQGRIVTATIMDNQPAEQPVIDLGIAPSDCGLSLEDALRPCGCAWKIRFCLHEVKTA